VAETRARTGPSGADRAVLLPARQYAQIARMWVRASLAYPASFAMFAIGSFLATGLDFVGLFIIFTRVDTLGGFGLREVALLYGVSGLGIGLADLAIGNVERLGQLVRSGELDVMMTRPVPLLVQVCADRFALRRLARIVQTGLAFAWGAGAVTWDPARVLVALIAVASSATIFFCLFVLFSTFQFWWGDASELANAFTYGGNTLTQYPLTVFPRELVVSLTFVLPIAFVNWYPCLFLLGRGDPFGLPSWLQLASPLAAALLLAVTLAFWRLGVRHYTSTGS
jgi:ABC-2 type transport system permease protein